MELIGILLILGLLIGSLLGWAAFFKARKLESEVETQRRHLQTLMRRLEGASTVDLSGAVSDPFPDVPETAPAASSSQASIDSDSSQRRQNVWLGETESEPFPAESESNDLAPAETLSIIDSFRDQWMIWLGGLSVGLSGIFMVRYSMDQGLLSPMTRIVLSLCAGAALHVLAEWGRRRNQHQFNAIAALAGGASIILFSALLASLFLYNLFPPSVVFFALMAVALGTMALSLLHGPVLAIMGILAAYAIPALVDTGGGSVSGLYLYSLIITASALLLMRYVYRPWLWAGMLTGALAWWLLTLDSYQAHGLRGYYLAALLYLFLAIPHWDWRLAKLLPEINERRAEGDHSAGLLSGLISRLRGVESSFPQNLFAAPGSLSLGLLVLAFAVSIAGEQRLDGAIYQWTPFVGILLLAAGAKPELLKFVALSLITQGLAWLSLGLTVYEGVRLEGLVGPGQFEFLLYAAWMGFVYTALSLRNLAVSNSRNFCCAIAIASPLAWLSLSYLLVSDLSESLSWGAIAVVLGLLYLALAAWRMRLEQLQPLDKSSEERDYFGVWLIMAGHFAYSLAVAIMVREAGLTLALSAQLFSVAWLIHRYDPPKLGLFLKLILAVVVTRLTLNPWLLTYPVDVHWSLWTFGGATLFAGAATWRLRENEELGKWLELASLHLLLLTLWAEVRFYLYDGEIFAPRIDLLEFSLNTALWSSLALVYYLRHKVSKNLKPIYLLASKILLAMGAASYLSTLTFLNPFWTGEVIGASPLFNVLLLSFGAPVIIGALLAVYYDPTYRKKIIAAAAFMGFVFINAEIRHLWNGELSSHSITSNGELYTYTIVWLVLAVVCLLAGSIRFGSSVYRAGFGLMMVVIGKIFLLDMADLEGLLRVASFMGLGLSLLGLAYLYQRFNLSPNAADSYSDG